MDTVRAKRARQASKGEPGSLRFTCPPQKLLISIGEVAPRRLRITVEHHVGRDRWFYGATEERTDAEGRLPAETVAELYRVLRDFVEDDQSYRASRRFY